MRSLEYLNGHKLGVYYIETNFRGEGRTLRKIQKGRGICHGSKLSDIQIQNDKSKQKRQKWILCIWEYCTSGRNSSEKNKESVFAQREQTKRTSSRVVKNRNRAMSISPAYAVFLTAAAVCAVLICVLYLNLQSEVVSRSENVTAMQEQLADLTEANNTAYNSAADSVNLETVRDKAMNEMGMVYAAQGTIVEYDSPEEDYVKQYNDIPESGVLAKSGDVLK